MELSKVGVIIKLPNAVTTETNRVTTLRNKTLECGIFSGFA
jgi:hypothetical protein